jgi:hypothetical protein
LPLMSKLQYVPQMESIAREAEPICGRERSVSPQAKS